MALACPDVVLLEDQPPAMHFMAAMDARSTSPDYRITTKTNKFFVAVKPTHQVEKTGIEDVIQRLKPSSRATLTKLVLVTKARNPCAIGERQVIRNAVRNRNADDCEEMRKLVQGICGQVTCMPSPKRASKYARRAERRDLPDPRTRCWSMWNRTALLLERPFVRLAR